MNKQTILYKTLQRALSVARPHATKTTAGFTRWLKDNANKTGHGDPKIQPFTYTDAVGNLHIDTRTTADHKTLFVAHVDTVHKSEGVNKIRKTDTRWYADGAQLGADDGAGCAMLMHLLRGGVPAYYIFTQGEEKGGIGAKYLADNYKELLGTFDRAIAFDRRGNDSVITHQGWGRCCSDLFGDALADALNTDDMDMMYARDDSGVYTDTAEFTDLIPECTNISVGYLHEHTDRESLDILHFQKLANAALKVHWDALPTDRDPTIPDPDNKWDSYDTDWWNKSYGLTSVTGIEHKTDSTWRSYADPQTDLVYEALYDARYGFKDELLDLAAAAAWPDDPQMARRMMSSKRLTIRKIDTIIEMAEAFEFADTDDLLLNVFDTVYQAH